MSADFRLIMIGAMYENGGNTTQRFLDGHPELFSYPFESQPGTKYVLDHLTSMFPVKYRWPVFPLNGTPAEDYETIIDEECKVRLKTPQASKFRDYPLAMDDKNRKARFLVHMEGRPRTRAALV
ncbi:MAG: sulfotransferase, partial [Planctomycetes bacterium]|nr:sulfotransferase [Planctomycetota bacterium]